MTKYALFIFFVLILHYCSCNIHRAIPGSPGFTNQAKFKSNAGEFIDEDEDDEVPGLVDSILLKVNTTWVCAIAAAVLVGSTGILPLFIFKVDDGHEMKEAISPAHLNLLLSFAVGGLLGDVFLHLLPESYMYINKNSHDHYASTQIGLWIIGGFLCFMIIEKIFFEEEKLKERVEKQNQIKEIEAVKQNGFNGKVNGHTNGKVNSQHSNGTVNGRSNGTVNGHKIGAINEQRKDDTGKKRLVEKEICKTGTMEPGDEGEAFVTENHIKIIGYLNLLANCIDNFTHGLAVGGSFLVSIPVGTCTTFAIMLHEIPHEIGDFAILLRAGFNRWEAAKGQLITASGALIGCLFGLLAESAGDSSAWVLPFTSGGFIYISMVTIVPDLVKEENFKESLKQIVALLVGLTSMAFVSLIQH